MNVKISTIFDNSLESNSIEINIKASKNSKQLQTSINNIESISNSTDILIGKNENKIYIIPIKDIILFYSDNNNNYCKTSKGDFRINKRMYELENMDRKHFIRISKSCIININYVESFDLTYVGNITVKLENGLIENVSKRKIPDVMHFLNSFK